MSNLTSAAWPATLPRLFLDRVAQTPQAVALRFRRHGEMLARTWQELADAAERVAAGLRAEGVQPGDRIAQLSENRAEWIVADLGIQLAGAIHVPIHAPLAAPQVLYQLQHSGARLLFVSQSEQQAKVAQIASELPPDFPVVHYEPASGEGSALASGPRWSCWDDFLASAPSASARGERTSAATSSLSPDSIATILYTSGTTGQPKGVVLTHRNLISNAYGTQLAFGMQSDEVRLCFLPLSHIFARTCDLYTWIGLGYQLCLATSRESVLDDCQWSQPTIMSGVPYFYDRCQRILRERGEAERVGSLRELLGGHVRYCCSGGAALADHTFDFFTAQQVPILQGYGLTETSPVISISSPTTVRRGASGKPIQDAEVRIAEDGEILTRGPQVMPGYWQDLAATAEVIRDGWFHTGDFGHLDDDGYLYITGRKKELIVTAAGKNIAPVYLESLLTEDPLIDQAMVIGDERNYLGALIVVNLTALQAALPEQPLACLSDCASCQQVHALIETRIAERLRDVSYHEQVRRFTLLPRGFTIELQEMTPKLSLRRQTICEHFRDEIEAMYGGTASRGS